LELTSKGNLPPTNLRAFRRHPSLFKISQFGVSNFRFVSNIPIPLNIVVKLNGKMRYFSNFTHFCYDLTENFNGMGKVEGNQSLIHQSERF
jgi:hypothetical protein